MDFITQLAGRALSSLLTSMGTTALALLFGFVGIPCVLWLLQLRRKGWAAMKAHWAENSKEPAVVTLVLWLALYGYHLFYKVPHEIRVAAATIHVPFLPRPPSPPVSAFLLSNMPKRIPAPTATGPLAKSNISLTVLISSPSDPAITVENPSDAVVDGVRWELVMFRTSDQAFFSYVTQHIGYVKPHSKSARYTMQLNSLPHAPGGGQLIDGDKLIGTLSVDCPICKGNTLIVSFVWGSSGWFFEMPEGNGKLLLPKDMSQGGIEQFIDSLHAITKPDERHPII